MCLISAHFRILKCAKRDAKAAAALGLEPRIRFWPCSKNIIVDFQLLITLLTSKT
jgi:hypothetical protein